MKKVSTAVLKQSRNFSQHKLTIGLDLGDRSSCYCVLDETGGIVLEQRVATTPKALQAALGAMARSRIALETGMHSPWVSRLLSGLGHEVIVAHARNVGLIGESRRKDDRLDAQTMARLARIGPQLLSPVKHRSAQAQADLTLIRARAGLVRARTALVNTARGLCSWTAVRSCCRQVNQAGGSDSIPELPSDGTPPPQPHYFPPKSGFRFAFFTIPPDTETSVDQIDIAAALEEIGRKLPGMMDVLEPDHPGMSYYRHGGLRRHCLWRGLSGIGRRS